MEKYSELVKIRAKELYENGFLTDDEYYGTGYMDGNCYHVCWFSVCIDHRNDWWACEECGRRDPNRSPAKE